MHHTLKHAQAIAEAGGFDLAPNEPIPAAVEQQQRGASISVSSHGEEDKKGFAPDQSPTQPARCSPRTIDNLAR